MSVLRQTKMTLIERLQLHTGFSISAEAEHFAGDTGPLQHVGRQFIKVNGQYLVPQSLRRIHLYGFTPQVQASAVKIRLAEGEPFPAGLVRTGSDFVELLLNEKLVLIPLRRIVSIEPA